MKINGATSLLELQKLLHEQRIDITGRYSGAAGCFQAIVTGPRKDDEHSPQSAAGIGRDLGEAIANAYDRWERTR